MKYYLENTFEMPDKMVALLIRFLGQNQGELSKRAQDNEFSGLMKDEIINIEKRYKEIFLERCLSGRKDLFAKQAYSNRVPGVRIPVSPQI